MRTPEFLVWSLEYGCPVRGFEDGSDPERVERQLRAARAFSDASREGRVFEGLVLDPPQAFRIDDALAIYGGQVQLEIACRGCPANALEKPVPSILAGCYGHVPLAPDQPQIHEAVERAIDKLELTRDIAQNFPRTNPSWYGLWIDSPLAGERLRAVHRLMTAVGLVDLADACRAAISARLPLHVRLYPRGRVEGGWWLLDPHCPKCHAPWQSPCAVCGYAGRPAADKKRRARGARPYRPLERLLGPEQAAELLVRYEAFRARTPPPDRLQNPPPPEPPGSLPAD
jgi:hypothetical protein